MPASAWTSSGGTGELPRSIGRYLVERRLGQGGMADIFLCRQVGMGGFDRLVVVKQIRGDLRVRDDVIHMFLDEARIAAQISHPNVVQIFEIDEAGGLPYLVMEYVRGISFAALQQSLLRRQRLPPVDFIAALGAQVCAGLQAAHELRDSDGVPLQVVHRDVSPHNLLLSSNGVVKIIDFGIARAKNRLARTAAGQIKGRLAYLAPELMGAGAIDRRVDVFSLAVVLHELACGRLLFERSDDIATLGAVLTGQVPRLEDLRDTPHDDDKDEALRVAELESVLRRALSIDPQSRPESAADLGAQLHAVAMRTGRFVSAAQVSRYLDELLGDELSALPQHQVPTTAKVPLPAAPTQPKVSAPRGDSLHQQTTQDLPKEQASANEQLTAQVQLPAAKTSDVRTTQVVDRADQPTTLYQLGQEATEEFATPTPRPPLALIAAAAAGGFLGFVLLLSWYLLRAR